MKSPNLPKHGLYCVLRCPELCQIDGLVESDTELAIHAFGTDSEHYRTQIELKLSSQEVWILKLSSQEVKNRRTFQNPDLRLDFDVGWHSKSSLQVWSRSAVSKWPKIASAHLIFSKDGMISAVWVMIFAVRAIIFGDFSMRRWL